jgi:hypothetical protein
MGEWKRDFNSGRPLEVRECWWLKDMREGLNLYIVRRAPRKYAVIDAKRGLMSGVPDMTAPLTSLKAAKAAYLIILSSL